MENQENLVENQSHDQDYWKELYNKKSEDYNQLSVTSTEEIETLKEQIEALKAALLEKDKQIFNFQTTVEQKDRLLEFFYREQENSRVEIVIHKHKVKESEERLLQLESEIERQKSEITKMKNERTSFFTSNNEEFENITSPRGQRKMNFEKVPISPVPEKKLSKVKSLFGGPRLTKVPVSESDFEALTPKKIQEDLKRKQLESRSVFTEESPKKKKI